MSRCLRAGATLEFHLTLTKPQTHLAPASADPGSTHPDSASLAAAAYM